MGNYRFVKDMNQEEYDGFVKNHQYCNLLQSYNWAKVKKNWDHLYTGVYNSSGRLVGTGLVLIKQLPMHLTMFYLPRGPIMDYLNEDLMVFYFNELKKIAKQHHCVMIKLDPAIHVNDYKSSEYNENRYPSTERYMEIFKKIGAVHYGFTTYIEETAQARYISNVYYQEDIEANLPKHTKRLIKDADRRNVQIVHGGPEFLDDFSRLVAMTEDRKHVALRDEDYFRLLMDTYGDDAVIFLAKCNVYDLYHKALDRQQQLEKDIADNPANAKKKLRRLQDQLRSTEKEIKEFKPMLEELGNENKEIAIAGILSIQYGNTCEMLYAGMDQRFKKFMPQYKEYIENFKWAFDRGCKYADMGGVEGTLDDGLTKFKDNFNPTINEFIGEFDIPVNKLLYPAAKKAYQKMKASSKK
ncbi:peptidoglycan bridge formation glycyltransferase FemA/FemB family protein [Catenisphaera adipataccumulans]|uniref:Serine/alanine adding enzyme n=1 Tax=Catenisphaera adipataccumulans TaxID=700500 RepID=A0A7W8FW43_9FIRM|nr:peptidoglycan bridge formation glycyltransferase FemA/FemB family protein [Catenisphaera adipataccumulans]MBB5183848.1 serine/alanine adding enzyme [Catenisphaera adipataccumulans]